MEVAYLLTFAGGLVLGLILSMALLINAKANDAKDACPSLKPTLTSAACDGVNITVQGTANSPIDVLERTEIYAVATANPSAFGAKPGPGEMSKGNNFPINVPPGPVSGHVVVWVEYKGYGKETIAYTCPEGPP